MNRDHNPDTGRKADGMDTKDRELARLRARLDAVRRLVDYKPREQWEYDGTSEHDQAREEGEDAMAAKVLAALDNPDATDWRACPVWADCAEGDVVNVWDVCVDCILGGRSRALDPVPEDLDCACGFLHIEAAGETFTCGYCGRGYRRTLAGWVPWSSRPTTGDELGRDGEG